MDKDLKAQLEDQLYERMSHENEAYLEELNALLNMDKKEPEIVDAEPDDTIRPPSRPTQQMER